MKKWIGGIALAAAAATALTLPTAGIPAAPDVRGKPCLDIFLTASYIGTEGASGTVDGTLTTPSAPSCPGAVYTVYVIDGGTHIFTFVGDGTTESFSYSVPLTNAPHGVCVYATSQTNSKSNSFADVAPNGGCTASTPNLTISTGGGASGFN